MNLELIGRRDDLIRTLAKMPEDAAVYVAAELATYPQTEGRMIRLRVTRTMNGGRLRSEFAIDEFAAENLASKSEQQPL